MGDAADGVGRPTPVKRLKSRRWCWAGQEDDRIPEPPSDSIDVDVLSKLARKRKAGEACGVCGHWSVATEYGVDDQSGYCSQWEKLTSRDFWCEEFISESQYRQLQDDLAEANEDLMDDD